MNSEEPKQNSRVGGGNWITDVIEWMFDSILSPIFAALFIVSILYWIPRIILGVF